jgi:glutathione-specific gamma-glutamylcyclotransferase
MAMHTPFVRIESTQVSVNSQQKRSPLSLLHQVQQQWGGQDALWIFGYASLIWRPEFSTEERRPATVHGWHRAFKMKSRVNRGTPEQPGLVFALLSGGLCKGMVYRLPSASASEELVRLWQREMPNGVYDPRWLQCRTADGPVTALAFTLSRRSPSFTGHIPDHDLLQILRTASGRYGTTLDYLVRTAESLAEHSMCDSECSRLLALARRQGLA